ncbi:uncharacterized protein EAF02_012127 [Botrytis sinoallii]|uniref:uncharacterized protein n=1 Tax=Botrytis sinoallii TaxID=1463999 RepID=UPI001900F561|nr:uncharacterized protein EAF02_012127 [Botrytis sinoallii]KAF7852897.1 hypothetical protein EAF02_012127 [Botrytis sinoallii]
MSPKGGSEKITSANLEIGSTISQASASFLDRHGLPLVPQPSYFKDDPLVGFYNFSITNDISKRHNPSLVLFSKAMGVSSKTAAYNTTTYIIIGWPLCKQPFIWNPCTNVYGRRPIALLTTVIGGIGSACSPNFATLEHM